MGIEYSLNWSDYSNGHLTSQATATKVINRAEAALKDAKTMSFNLGHSCRVGRSSTAGSYLEVFKG